MLPNTTRSDLTLIVLQKLTRPAVLPSDTILHGKVNAPSLIDTLYPSFNRTHLELENIVTKQFDQSLRESMHMEVTLTP